MAEPARVAESASAPAAPPATTLADQIRRGRMFFIAMAVAYTLGNFNDNFNKQAVSLLALSHHHTGLPGLITILFTIPFLLFYAAAGWLADRFPRRRVIIASKIMELIFLGLGGVGIMTLNWPLIVAVIFLMAVQATIFGPAQSGRQHDLRPLHQPHGRTASPRPAFERLSICFGHDNGWSYTHRCYPRFLRGNTQHPMISYHTLNSLHQSGWRECRKGP